MATPLILPAVITGDAADQPAAPSATGSIEQPAWQVGDSWIIETLTQRVQGRDASASPDAPRVRWQFRVAKIDKVAGTDCYRIEVQCLADARVRPRATLWCDQQNLFLRQFETQVAFRGQYRTVQESYACPKGMTSPVMTFANALPVTLPAFLPAGSKATSFAYTSQPLPAGSKDAGAIRFNHDMQQQIAHPSAKSLENLGANYSKNLDSQPVVEVKLVGQNRSVTQLWKKGAPWPVYSNDGRTQAWLVEASR